MAGYKLSGRIEEAEWNPPVLSFIIERHGATVQGSSRAELQVWNIDINAKTATRSKVGYRQLYRTAPRVYVRPLAEEVVQLILEGKSDERLKWYDDGSVRVHIGKIFPTDSALGQTVARRRRRFRKAIEELLEKKGWTCPSYNLYQPPAS